VVTQADLDTGTIVNIASAQSTDPNGQPTSGSSSVSVAAAQTKLLTLTKTALSTSYSAVGEIVSYTIDTHNSGNVSFHDVSVSDPTASLGTCNRALPVSSLLPGDTFSCPATHVITQADLDAGSLANTATAQGTDPQNNVVTVADIEVVNATQTKALGVHIATPTLSYAAVGNNLIYPISITNSGNVTLANLSTTLPAGVTFTCPVFVNGDPSTSLAPGATVTCSATRIVTQADLDAGTFLLTIAAVADDPSGAPVAGSDLATTTAAQSPSLSVVKTAALPSYSAVGDAAQFAITLTNTGNVTLASVNLLDDNGILSACDTGLPAAQLAPGVAVHCTATHIVTQGDLDAGSIVNNATGLANLGVTPITNTDQAIVNASQIKSLTVVNTPTTSVYSAVGDLSGFSVMVTNNGNVTLTGVTLNDPNVVIGVCTPTIPVTSLAPGSSINCAATHVATQTDVDAGYVLTNATATGTDPKNSIVTDSDNATVVGSQSGGLIVNKAKTSLSFAHVGDRIAFTVSATNVGNVTLTSVTLVDATATLSNCTPGNPTTLAPGEMVNCSAIHIATQADIDAGTLVNTATGSGMTPTLTIVRGIDLASVPAAQTAAIALTNKTPSATFNTVGDVITYAVDITNEGNVTLSGLSLLDGQTLVVCTPSMPMASLAPGETIHCEYTHVVAQTDVDSGSVIASALVAATSPSNSGVTASDTATVAAVQTDILTVVNTTPATSYGTVGELINYTSTITNDGNTTLSSVNLSHPNATIGVCTPALPVASLAPGGTITCAAVHVATQADIDAGSIATVAKATASSPNGSEVNGVDAHTVAAQQSSQLAVTNNADLPKYVAVGEVVTYTYTATNTGNVTLSALSMTDPDTVIGSCTPALPVGAVAPGEVVTCTTTHVVTQADLDAGTIRNMVNVTATTPTNSAVNGSAPASVAAAQTKAITLSNLPSTASYTAVGTPVAFTLTLTNTGNVTLRDVTLTDPSTTIGNCTPALAVTSLAPRQTVVCEAVHVVTQIDLDAGSIVTVASATGNDPSGSPVIATTPGTVAAAQTKSIGVTIEASTPTFDTLGKTVSYAITFTNLGNVTLQRVSLSDPNIVFRTCTPTLPVAFLAPGVTVSCTATHMVTQADLDLGNITSTAVVAGTDPNSLIVSGRATIKVNAVQSASLAAAATAVVSPTSSARSTTTFAEPGQTITYTEVYTNTGNVTLFDVTAQTPNAILGRCTPVVPVPSLAPGAILTCKATHLVTQADIDAGLLLVAPGGSAIDVNDGPVAGSTTVQVAGADAPLLSVTNASAQTVYDTVAKSITYRIVLENSGNVTLSNIGVGDPVATIGQCVDATGATVVLPVATLLPGATIMCEASHSVTQADLDSGSILAVATGSASTPKGALLNAFATSTIVANQAPQLVVTEVADVPSFAAVGEIVTYTYAATNTGNVSLSALAITDPTTTLGVCVPSLPILLLAPGAKVSCTATHMVTLADLDLGKIVSNVVIVGNELAGKVVRGRASVEVPAQQTPSVGAATSVSAESAVTTPAKPREIVTYSVVYTNTGNVTLSGLVPTIANATLGTCAPILPVTSLAPNATITCTATHLATQADIDSGMVKIVAKATAAGPNGTAVSVVDSSNNTTLVKTKRVNTLSVVKVIRTPTYSLVGDELHSTVTVTNTGNTTLADMVLSDPYFNHVSCVPQIPLDDLLPGAGFVCERIHVVTRDDLNGLTIEGTATVNASGPDGEGVRASSTARIAATIIVPSTTTLALVFQPVSEDSNSVKGAAPTVPASTVVGNATVPTVPAKAPSSPVDLELLTGAPSPSNGANPSNPSTSVEPVAGAKAKPQPGDQVAYATSNKPTSLKLPAAVRENELVTITKQPESGTVTVDPITHAVIFTPSLIPGTSTPKPSPLAGGIDTYESTNFDVCDTITKVCEHKTMRIRVLHASINAEGTPFVGSLAFTGANSLILLLGATLSVLTGALLLVRRRKVV
jgi:uncharacterized repeat protein (TIGR01451 family)